MRVGQHKDVMFKGPEYAKEESIGLGEGSGPSPEILDSGRALESRHPEATSQGASSLGLV